MGKEENRGIKIGYVDGRQERGRKNCKRKRERKEEIPHSNMGEQKNKKKKTKGNRKRWI